MLILNKELNPSANYSFQTSPSGRTEPMPVKQFLRGDLINEELVAVHSSLDDKSSVIWTTYNGWDIEAYKGILEGFISFIDASQEVNPEFIDCALQDELSISEAVESWFNGTELAVDIEHHLRGTSGLIDVDIQGVGSVRRVVLSMDIAKGDMFNVYYGESAKGGGTWNTDLKTSLTEFFFLEAA
jgi:hypothetical protein